jgi:hypothetical protein
MTATNASHVGIREFSIIVVGKAEKYGSRKTCVLGREGGVSVRGTLNTLSGREIFI